MQEPETRELTSKQRLGAAYNFNNMESLMILAVNDMGRREIDELYGTSHINILTQCCYTNNGADGRTDLNARVLFMG